MLTLGPFALAGYYSNEDVLSNPEMVTQDQKHAFLKGTGFRVLDRTYRWLHPSAPRGAVEVAPATTRDRTNTTVNAAKVHVLRMTAPPQDVTRI